MGMGGGWAPLRRGLGSVALVMVMTTGCGGGSSPSGGLGVQSLTKVDACSLLTEAEIEAALGKPGKGGVPPDVSGNSVGCDWDGEAETDAIGITLQVDRFDADLWAIETKAEGVEPMPGIGDEAVRGWITNGLLLIRKGGYEIDLGVIAIFADDARIKAAQQTLGTLVASRL